MSHANIKMKRFVRFRLHDACFKRDGCPCHLQVARDEMKDGRQADPIWTLFRNGTSHFLL